jgi:hypothetical protein
MKRSIEELRGSLRAPAKPRLAAACELFELERENQLSRGYTENRDTNHHTVPSFLLMLERHLAEAKEAWYTHGDGAALKPLVQIGTLAAACIQSQYEDDR